MAFKRKVAKKKVAKSAPSRSNKDTAAAAPEEPMSPPPSMLDPKPPAVEAPKPVDAVPAKRQFQPATMPSGLGPKAEHRWRQRERQRRERWEKEHS
jgi:hypothetical protein